MKSVRMTFGASLDFTPTHPDRTGRRSTGHLGEWVEFKEWPSRAALRVTIDLQDKRERRADDWRMVRP